MTQQVLIIGYVWLEKTTGAGNRMFQLIELFLKNGYKITFASPAQKTKNSLDLILLNIDEVAIELNSSSFDDFIKELQPNLVVFDRFMMEEQFGWRVAENCPQAIRILDTEDLHSLRKTRQDKLKKGLDFKVDNLLASDITKREIASILRCDVSLIISSFEMDLLKNLFKVDESLLLHLPFLLNKIDDKQTKNWLPFEDREHFVFVGNFLHAPNVDAVLQLKLIWKLIRKQLPKIEVHIYGAYATQQINQLQNEKEGFIVKGFVENIEEVIRKAKVVIAPLQFGAGIKGKLTEAMICGTPSITTSIGSEGMHYDFPWNGVVEDNYNEFAAKAVELYSNKTLWVNSQKNGIEIINKLYDKERLGKTFIKRIESTQQNLTEHRKQNFLGSLLQHQTLQATKYMSKWIEEKNKS
ncbi:glycosyltransferase involved in cell wall biosynthesis [Tenacibaculum adriaticum]|uniref:Glycosyltransferase involved in cell wall biosynthesis n=1 Tax=Tenacibaculum adriaticum TaxID=413713 RepID=A0A5S5DPR9_9FLAO|nr:glycosyltransferase [Tenacibaculum adriaticum]TYP97891.1 glycosyltransferase involved in cell wall biosynthesis [Tenacibaculum adriaticum]